MAEELVTTQQALVVSGSTSNASASQAIARVQAKYAIAARFPRDPLVVRRKVLDECENPSFADKALYLLPVGDKVEGLSIRFAEVFLRCSGNFDVTTVSSYDDQDKRILEVAVIDLETNTSFAQEVTVTKSVERRNPKGRQVLGHRLNSSGTTVYEVRATDDEITSKQQALISKGVRNQAHRHLPYGLKVEATNKIKETNRKEVEKDPRTAQEKIVDAFSVLGVRPEEIVAYTGRPLSQIDPAQIDTLRGIYNAIKDGVASWQDYATAGRDAKPPAEESKTSKVAEALKNKG